jgi:predicted nucleotidyltransferase
MNTQAPQQRLEAELWRCLDLLITHYRPQRILLFGSLAQGQAGHSSDIDLIIIKRTDKRFLDRVAEVLRLVKPREALDVFVYTPEEFEQLCRERLFFKEEILRKAKVLYDAQRSTEMDQIRRGGSEGS